MLDKYHLLFRSCRIITLLISTIYFTKVSAVEFSVNNGACDLKIKQLVVKYGLVNYTSNYTPELLLNYEITTPCMATLNTSWGSQFWILADYQKGYRYRAYSNENIDMRKVGKFTREFKLEIQNSNISFSKGIFGVEIHNGFCLNDIETGHLRDVIRPSHMIRKLNAFQSLCYTMANLTDYELFFDNLSMQEENGKIRISLSIKVKDTDGQIFIIPNISVKAILTNGTGITKEITLTSADTKLFESPSGIFIGEVDSDMDPTEIQLESEVKVLDADGMGKIQKVKKLLNLKDIEKLSNKSPKITSRKYSDFEVTALLHFILMKRDSSKNTIDKLIDDAKKMNIHELYLIVYYKGVTFIKNSFFKTTETDFGFDWLEYSIKTAHKNKLKVHLVFGIFTIPDEKLLKVKHPPFAAIKPDGSKSNRWPCLSSDWYRGLIAGFIEEVVTRYPETDGIMYDFIRCQDTCVCEKCAAAYFKKYDRDIRADSLLEDESDASISSLLNWKGKGVEKILQLLKSKLRKLNPQIQLSVYAGMAPNPIGSSQGQIAWKWVNEGLIDFVNVGCYTDYKDEASIEFIISQIAGYTTYLDDPAKCRPVINLSLSENPASKKCRIPKKEDTLLYELSMLHKMNIKGMSFYPYYVIEEAEAHNVKDITNIILQAVELSKE